MSVDFSRIKKYSKTSNNFDEKLEYLNKELKKTGLCEIANSTSGMYSVTKQEPNSSHNAFKALSHDGQSMGFSGANYNIFTEPIGGLKYSPPHPVTGQRLVAQSYYGIASDFRPVPANSDREIIWVFDQSLAGGAGRYFSMELTRGLSPNYFGVWIDTAFGTSILVPYEGNLSPLSDRVKNNLNNLNVNNFNNPEQFGPPTNPILFQNRLGDPNHLPINLDNLSPQGFEWLKKKAQDKNETQDTKIAGLSSFEQQILRKGLDAIIRQKGYEAGKREQERLMKMYGIYFPLASNPNLGAQPGDLLAFGGFGGGKPKTPTKKSDFKGVKRNAATTAATMSINGMGISPAAFEKKYGISPQDFLNLPENKTSHKKYLEEGVKLGYFEPEVLNVNIDDIRKGIMPEFPKNPPPEMIDGYAANSRLAPKKIKGSPFIKITKKDLAKNHLLTDKQISDFMNDIKMINDYIKKNPSDLIYAQQRYPKHDPRLAQLNWQMDQMLEAGEEYVDKQFPENQKLFNQIKKKIKNTIDQTDPKNFKGTKLPKFDNTSLEDFKRKKEVYSRFMKKPINIKKLFQKTKKRG